MTAGPHDVGFTWQRAARPAAGRLAARAARQPGSPHGRRPAEAARPWASKGPYNVTGVSATPSRERIFVCQPGVGRRRAGVRARGSSRTWRGAPIGGRSRPTTSRRRSLLQQARAERRRLRRRHPRRRSRAFSSSPSFLYRIERDPAGVRPGAAHPVSDVELASRLSFFLWSSIPDEQLLDLADGRPAARSPACSRRRCAG